MIRIPLFQCLNLIVKRPTTLESKATQAARGVDKAINFSLESCKPPFLSSCHITITWWMYFNITSNMTIKWRVQRFLFKCWTLFFHHI